LKGVILSLLLTFLFTVQSCFLPYTGVEELLCLVGSEGQSVSEISAHCALPVIRPPPSRRHNLCLGFAPRQSKGCYQSCKICQIIGVFCLCSLFFLYLLSPITL
uniref:Uncharacterized protein n=1 Tax=Astatotilapia calliptera TaxID=8154 RepID=A0A3P8P7B4_ASTCA